MTDHTHSLQDTDVILQALAAWRVLTPKDADRATRLIDIISSGFETVTRDCGFCE